MDLYPYLPLRLILINEWLKVKVIRRAFKHRPTWGLLDLLNRQEAELAKYRQRRRGE